MKPTQLTRSTSRLAMAVAILAGLLLLHGAGTAAASVPDSSDCHHDASGHYLCPPRLSAGYGVVTARWDGNWDAYNVIWEWSHSGPAYWQPLGRQVDDIEGHSASIPVESFSLEHLQYRVSVQGCDQGLFGSSCMRNPTWLTAEIEPGRADTREPTARSLESFNYPGYFVRHRFSLGEITRVTSALDRADASFIIRPALNGAGDFVSFESVNYPGQYLRHQDFRLKLSADDGTELFRDDASFLRRSGLADHLAWSYQPANFLGYYIRHSNYQLWIARDDGSQVFKSDATFWERPPRQ